MSATQTVYQVTVASRYSGKLYHICVLVGEPQDARSALERAHIELTADNPEALDGTRPDQYEFVGVHPVCALGVSEAKEE